jgi:hypothetical protein
MLPTVPVCTCVECEFYVLSMESNDFPFPDALLSYSHYFVNNVQLFQSFSSLSYGICY